MFRLLVFALLLALPRPAEAGRHAAGPAEAGRDATGDDRQEAAPAAGRMLVVAFENAAHEPRLHWLTEACAVLLTDELNARGIGAFTRAERVRAFEELRLPLSASLSRATVIKVGQLLGASEVIVGRFIVAGGDLSIDVQSIRIDVGRLQPPVAERGALTEMFGLFVRVGKRLTSEQQPAPGRPSVRDPLPPLDGFESYIKGLVAESPAAQAMFLEAAVKQFPGYDRALVALWDVRTEQDDHAAALAAAQSVAKTSRLSGRARFLAAVSLLNLKRYEQAFDAFNTLLDEQPGPAVYNNLGVVQIRRGATPQTGTATYYLTRAADTDPGDPDALFNLGYAYMLEKNPQGAAYWLRESVRRNPLDADAHYVLAASLQGSGSSVEAERERELAAQLSSRYEEIALRAGNDKTAVPRGLERVRTDQDNSRALRPEQPIVDSAQRDQRDLAQFHLESGRRLFDHGEDREAMTELRRAIYLSPYEAQAHLLIGRIHLRAGRPQEAVNALKISIWSEDSVAARVTLAEAYLKIGDTMAAKGELEHALALDPSSADAKRLLAGIK